MISTRSSFHDLYMSARPAVTVSIKLSGTLISSSRHFPGAWFSCLWHDDVFLLHTKICICKLKEKLQVEEAAKLANAHDFISSFPLGYRTPVGERGIGSSWHKPRASIPLARIHTCFGYTHADCCSGNALETCCFPTKASLPSHSRVC